MKKFISLLLLFSFLINVVSYCQPKPSKPNILFILTDDLGYGDLGVFFQKQRKAANNRNEPFELTPNLDALAASGAILTQNYCAAPVCAPSRASILLGVSQGHANVRDNQFDKALEDNYTIGNVLHHAGYNTSAIGKWGLQGLTGEPNWPAHPLKRGFDYYYGYMRHKDGHEHYPKEGLYDSAKQVWENYKEVSKGLDKCYTGDLWTATAKKWIVDYEKSDSASNPFFMYLAYDIPHAVLEYPTQAYPAGGGLNGGVQWLGEQGKMINTASGKPDSYVDPAYENATYDNDSNSTTPEVAWPDTYKRYATVISRIDREVGDLVQLLKDLNIYSNTIIVFTSDNGPSIESYLPKNYVPNQPTFFGSYGPFDGIKRDCWEGGVRMPTIVSWPQHINSNTIITAPNISYDWLPTFADAAGIVPPERTDGVSILPELLGKKEQQKQSLIYIEYMQEGKTPNFKQFTENHRNRIRNQIQLIRFGDTVGVRYNIKSAEDNFEIYDVVHDPQETKNLALDSIATATIQKQMKEKILQVRMTDTSARRPYDSAFVDPVSSSNFGNKLYWKAYDGDFTWVPDVNMLGVADSGNINSFNIHSIKKINTHNVYLLEGYVNVPKDETYTFYLTTNSKAFFRLHEASLIDEDYNYKTGTTKTATINLKAGAHPFHIYYLMNKNDKHETLKFWWKSNTRSKK